MYMCSLPVNRESTCHTKLTNLATIQKPLLQALNYLLLQQPTTKLLYIVSVARNSQ